MSQNYETVHPTGSASNSRIRSFKDLGRQTSLICIFILLIISILLLALSFVFPVFQRTPYEEFSVNYYWNNAKYIFDDKEQDDGSFNYNECGNGDKDQWCNSVENTGQSSWNLGVTTLIFNCLLALFVLYRVCHSKPVIYNGILWAIAGVTLLIYVLTLSSFLQFVLNWPYTKYCDYSGDDTGCNWETGIALLIVSMGLIIIVFMISISMLYPICGLFCPCLLPTEQNMPIYGRNPNIGNIDRESIDQSDQKTMQNNNDDDRDEAGINDHVSAANINLNPDRRRKIGCFISLLEWLSILSLSAIFIFLHVALTVLLIDSWNQATKGAQNYTDNQWINALCIDNPGYLNNGSRIPSIVTNINNECAFQFPDDDDTDYNGTWWTCCDSDTCDIAFNYSNLFLSYTISSDSDESQDEINEEGNLCLRDMIALTKASCHPEDTWFTPNTFNISLSPQERINNTNNQLDSTNSIVLCYLFCQQIWDHCDDFYLTNYQNMSANEVYDSAEEFCRDALAMSVRYEIFTDQCFAGCPKISVFYSFIIVSIVSMLVSL